MTHTELCNLGAKYMKNHGITKWCKPTYVVIEMVSTGVSQPDIYGFGSAKTQQIEVKVSRQDFISDKNKYQRIYPEKDVGQLRSYLCPEGMIKEIDLPEFWGLLWIDKNNNITEIVEPKLQTSCLGSEISIVCSIMRRSNIKSQIFSFKSYNK